MIFKSKEMIFYASRDKLCSPYKTSKKAQKERRAVFGIAVLLMAIARALIGNPEILFADEPTGNLDSETGAEIMSLLREINQTTGQTIIMVTHSPEAARNTSCMITVQDGVII